MNRGLLRWRMLGLLFAVIVIVALPYLVTRVNTDQAIEAAGWVNHSSRIKAAAYRVAYLSRDAESAAYRIVTGNEGELTQERFDLALKQLPHDVQNLRDLTRDSAEQQLRVGSLSTVVAGRDALLLQAVTHYRGGDRRVVLPDLNDASSLFKLRPLIDTIIAKEDALLASRTADAKRQSHDNALALAVCALGQLLLLALIVVVSERQIARRLQAEGRENEAVRRSQHIVQAVREPIALLDEQLRPLLVNHAFAQLYSMEDDKAESWLPLAEIGGGVWNDSALLQRLSDVMLRERELWDFELDQRIGDDVERRLLINARRLQQNETDRPTLLLTISDITVRALVEQQVQDLNRQLEGKVEQISDVNRELEAFSYSVSHDLRAPLRHISGFANKLERHLGDRADERAHHFIGVISQSAQRMGQLIEDLLVFSRLGRGAMRMQPVDMQTVAEEARAMAESDTEGRRIEWRMAPLPVVVGDENMLRVVWQNLLSNAVKYTGARDVARIEIKTDRQKDGSYHFSVIDNGAGFDMAYAGKLFGVFQRLHRASEFEGNGIGLANVRRIVARHGGKVWAEAELGEGATFHFSLPAFDTGEKRRQDTL